MISFGSNIAALQATRRLADSSASVSASFNRCSGARINSASDDPAGLAVAMALTTKSSVFTTAIRNANDGISALNIANGTLTNQSNILTRMMELAEQAINGTLSNSQRKNLQSEYSALIQEFGRIGDTTVFNSLNLLRGSTRGGVGSINLQIGGDGSVRSAISIRMSDSGSLSGTIDRRALSSTILDHGTAEELQAGNGSGMFFSVKPTGELVAIAFDSNGNYNTYEASTYPQGIVYEGNNSGTVVLNSDGTLSASVLAAIQSDLGVDFSGISFSGFAGGPDLGGTTAIEFTTINTQDAARSALTVSRQRLESIGVLLGTIGASQSRLTSAASQISSERLNIKAAAARITDVDVGQEVAELTASRIRQQTSAAVLRNANQLPQLLLSLLE